MIKAFGFTLVCLIFLLSLVSLVHAESSYVLPYPSSMPGSLNYKPHLIYENLSKYWYFGNFGQFEYSLKMADKYLVEAKTLFDYKQYLLGVESLEKSNYYFKNSLPSLRNAEREGKSISQKRSVLKEAALKHMEYLEKMDLNTPDIFIWELEKSSPTTLLLKKAFMDSVNMRKDNL